MLTLLVVAALLFLLLPLVVLLTLALLDEKRPASYSFHRSPGAGNHRAVAIYNSRLARLLNRLFGLWSLTVWSRIYFAPRKNDLPNTAISHELVHVDQWHHWGVYRFLAMYVRYGYVKNPLEVEARTRSGESLGTV